MNAGSIFYIFNSRKNILNFYSILRKTRDFFLIISIFLKAESILQSKFLCPDVDRF